MLPLVLLFSPFFVGVDVRGRETAAELYSALSRAVVGITCRERDLEYFGTGTVIDPAGLILTSVTVVPESASSIRVYLRGGRVLPGRLLASRGEQEFALVKIDSPRRRSEEGGGAEAADERLPAALPYVALGNSDEARLGASVYALGNAFRSIITDDRVAMSAGVVSGLYALEKTESDSTYVGPVIETNAPVNHGMDGGPVVDAGGRLVGVISLNYSRNRWLGTAVPINVLKPLVSPHRGWFSDGGHTYRVYAGLELEEIGGSEVRILRVARDSPAAAAGLRAGSLVTGINGKALASLEEFIRVFKSARPNEKIVLETVVDGQPSSADLVLWARF